MSASEKLGLFMADERWGSHDATVLAGLALTLKEAHLPKLLVLVEAVEQLQLREFESGVWYDVYESLPATLAALNEALP